MGGDPANLACGGLFHIFSMHFRLLTAELVLHKVLGTLHQLLMGITCGWARHGSFPICRQPSCPLRAEPNPWGGKAPRFLPFTAT